MTTFSDVVAGEGEPLAVELDEVPPVVGALVDGAQDVDDARLVLGASEHRFERVNGLSRRFVTRPRGKRSTTA
jgi:hypothetical protein